MAILVSCPHIEKKDQTPDELLYTVFMERMYTSVGLPVKVYPRRSGSHLMVGNRH